MRILLTGAAGRLGSRVCRHLAAQGEEVVAVDRQYLAGLPVRLHVVNLLDPHALYPLLDGCQAVVHLANYPDMLPGIVPQTIYTENVATDTHVIEAAMSVGVSRLVFSSSIQAMSGDRYGVQDLKRPSCLAYLPADGALPAVCGSFYALGKLAAENMLQFYARSYPDRSFTAIRFPWLVGNVDRFLRLRIYDAWMGRLDELFSYLVSEDAAALIAAVLKTNRPGYACCLPAAPNTRLGWSIPELIRTFYPQVPLRRPLEQIGALIDPDGLRATYGWEAKQVLDLPRVMVEGLPAAV